MINRYISAATVLSAFLWNGSAEAAHCRLGQIWRVHLHRCVGGNSHLAREVHVVRWHIHSWNAHWIHHRNRYVTVASREVREEKVNRKHKKSRRRLKEDAMHGDPIEDRVDESKPEEPEVDLPDAFAKSIMNGVKDQFGDWILKKDK